MAVRLREVVVVLFLSAVAIPGLEGQAPAPQSSTGVVIEGTIVDTAQGTIPGVRVTLEQVNNVVAATVSNAAGKFRFENIQPGLYNVKAMLQGFKTLVMPINVAGSQPMNLGRLTMQFGAFTETVTVKATTDLVSTQSATSGSTVSVDRMVAGARNALNVVTFAPGVEQVRQADNFYAIPGRGQAPGTESYAPIVSNPFMLTTEAPLSTFAADVDTASYANVRRFLTSGQLPPVDAVRVEELVNYFRFSYPEPGGRRPVSITAEVGECPWAPTHQLALVGVRARSIDDREVRGRNLVLLIDVSGSMDSPDKLPLVKTGLRMFVDTLRDADKIAIVVYAGASGLALPSTPGSDRDRIHSAIESLHAGGSTNGGEGLVLAYQVASENFIRGGINRVILATDGDFNVGVTSEGDLLQLIERQKQSGVFLSVLGVGTGNLKDRTMEMLADKGNGHYAYLDSLQEARRVLVREGGATLETVAKDVKFQIEFNPAQVAAWKLIGYENRLLAARDFNDDRKDGGELGAGHTVTVLYELVPVGALPGVPAATDRPAVDPLRYQQAPAATVAPAPVAPAPARTTTRAYADELLTVKVRYKQPDGDVSELIEQPVKRGAAAPHVPFAAAVAEFGLLLRDVEAPATRWDQLASRTKLLAGTSAAPADRQGFNDLVELAAGLKRIR
jgi:Ca-activated chloride channel family protein